MHTLDDDPRRFPNELRARLSRAAEKVMHTIGDSFIELGIEKGRTAGELEGPRCSIQRFLAARFGPLPLALREASARIEHHGELEHHSKLEHLVDRAATVRSLDEFLRALPFGA